jgi:hypothetical protein
MRDYASEAWVTFHPGSPTGARYNECRATIVVGDAAFQFVAED